ncbi:hypothetical protein VKT23_013033 [Stygiomarasmius scandens]|uniref:Uncharacterized protein n=1 Tax=Marasmiellus scandens TaxID=2682957 RepID=A0ABR1J7N6_9AGAR
MSQVPSTSLPLRPGNGQSVGQASSDHAADKPNRGSRRRRDENEASSLPAQDILERIGNPKKRKRNQTEDHLKPYKHSAQWYYRTRSPYISIGTNFHVSWAIEGNPDDPILEDMSDDDKKQQVDAYKKFINRVPGLQLHLLDLMHESKVADLEHFIIWLETQATQARTADTNLLKTKILSYMLKNPLTDTLDPPLSPEELSKANRGFSHPFTAMLLCPRKFRAGFVRNPTKVKRKLKEGISKVDNSSLPFFCYDIDLYNEDNLWLGLFRNPLLIRAARAILFGESKALTGIEDFSRAPRKSNAHSNGIKGIEPGFIAMICCQVRFALSSVESWEVTDGDFRYDVFHHDVIMKFENGEDSWGTETLQWWNQQVFGRASNNDDDEDGDDSDADPADENEQLARTQKERIMVKKTADAPVNADGC